VRAYAEQIEPLRLEEIAGGRHDILNDTTHQAVSETIIEFVLGWFFGLPISGINLVSNPLLQGQESGPKWLTGGTYGIEGGVACTISLILVTIFLWRTSLISATPELLKMTSEENPVTAEPVLTLRPADDQA